MSQSTSKPRVQIPLGAKYEGLSIDGKFVYAWPEEQEHPGDEDLHPRANQYLPKLANDAYWAYYGTDNLGRVYQCTVCSYLTMSKNARISSYRKHECKHCKDNGGHSTAWRNVYPDPVHEENYVDVLKLQSDQTEFDPEDPQYPTVPNHPTHLSRIQNQCRDAVSQKELIEITATSVAKARDKGQVPY